MADRTDSPKPVVLAYPFTGRWMARNSPARRVPSHGTHLMGTTYAIDFVGVDEAGRSGPFDWRSALASEPPERFVGFGRPILAPIAGTVASVHVQATESTDCEVTQGLPIQFWREDGKAVLPEESQIVDVCEPIG